MTIEEAKEVIEQDIPCELDADLIEALHMAIASLEAWEKVRQEIDGSRDALKTMIDGEWFAGKLKGLDCAVAIIDKHLQEIKNG